MKKILSMLLIVAMLISMVVVAVPTAFAADVPEGFTAIENFDNLAAGGKYYLTKDITVEGRKGIGSDVILDGGGHTVTYTGTTALFGWANNVTVKNLNMVGTIEASGNNAYNEGVLTNGFEGNSTIENCNFDVDLTFEGTVQYLGGVTGKHESTGNTITLKNIVNKGDITVNGLVINGCGGIIGWTNSSNAIIDNCVYEGNITITNNTGNQSFAGGIVGKIQRNATITNCINKGDVKLTHTAINKNNGVGGIVGQIDSTGNSEAAVVVDTCFNYGEVYVGKDAPATHAGGIIGKVKANSSVKVLNSVNFGKVSTMATSGWQGTAGIVGTYMTMNESWSWSAVKGGDLDIVNCHNYGDIYGMDAAGVLGSGRELFNDLTIDIEYCSNSGEITGSSEMAGGIAAYLGICGGNGANITVSNTYNNANVTSANHAGGIIGEAQAPKTVTIKNSVSVGDIKAGEGKKADTVIAVCGVTPTIKNCADNSGATKNLVAADKWTKIAENIGNNTMNDYWLGGAPYALSTGDMHKAFENKKITSVFVPVNKVNSDTTTKFTVGVYTNDTNQLVKSYVFEFNYADYGLVKGANSAKVIELKVADFFEEGITVAAGQTLGWSSPSDTMQAAWCQNELGTKIIGPYCADLKGFSMNMGDGAALVKDNTNWLPVNVSYVDDIDAAVAAVEAAIAKYNLDNKTSLVFSAEQWNTKAEGKNYYIMKNFTLTSGAPNFSNGTIYGLGHTITLSDGNRGLVNWGTNVTVKDLTLDGAIVTEGFENAGAVSPHGIHGGSVIDNVVSNVDITITGSGSGSIGGIVGKADGGSNVTIKNVTNNGDITYTGSGANTLGGIIGALANGMVLENVTNNGDIIINGGINWGKAGGIAGDANGNYTFINCHNNGDISTNQAIALGGITGALMADKTVKFEDCSNSGTLTMNARANVGGILGQSVNANVTMINCDNSGDIVASYGNSGNHMGIGGVVGFVEGRTWALTNCDNSGNIDYTPTGSGSANTQVGGILGRTRWATSVVIKNSVNTGNITVNWPNAGWDGAAGIVGSYMNQNNACNYVFENCTNYGDISAPGANGGIFGTTAQLTGANIKLTFTNCYNYGDVTGGVYGGGIFGMVGDNDTTNLSGVHIAGCVNLGEVKASNYAGGIAGTIAKVSTGSTIDKCVNLGNVTLTTGSDGRGGDCYKKVGGILADFGGKMIITNCINSGNLTSDNGNSVMGTFPITNAIETRWNGSDYCDKAGTFFTGNLLNDTYTTYESLGNVYLEGTANLEAATPYGGAYTDKPYKLGKELGKEEIYVEIAKLDLAAYSIDSLKASIAACSLYENNDGRFSEKSWAKFEVALAEAKKFVAEVEAEGIFAYRQNQINDAELALLAGKAGLAVAGSDIYNEILDAVEKLGDILIADTTLSNVAIYSANAYIAEAKQLILDGVEDTEVIDKLAAQLETIISEIESEWKSDELITIYVRTAEDFALMDGREAIFVLEKDLVIETPIENFVGTLYGEGHMIIAKNGLFNNVDGAIISNLVVTAVTDLEASLFGTAKGDVYLENITAMVNNTNNAILFENVAAIEEGTTSVNIYGVTAIVNGAVNADAGLVANAEEGTFVHMYNILFNGDVNGMAALVGTSEGEVNVEGAVVYGDITGTDTSAGIIGYATDLHLAYCYYEGNLDAVETNALVIPADAYEIVKCYGYAINADGALADGCDLDAIRSGEATAEINFGFNGYYFDGAYDWYTFIFTQMIGTDAKPVFADSVLEVNAVRAEDNGDGTYRYYNEGVDFDPENMPAFPAPSAPAMPDYDNLNKAIEKAEAIDLTKFTAESTSGFTAVIDAAIEARQALTQSEVDAAIAAINSAIAALRVPVPEAGAAAGDATELNKVIAKAEALKAEDYTAASWAAMQAVLAQAKATVGGTQALIDNAKTALEVVIAGLVKETVEAPVAVDYSKLTASIAKAEGLKAGEYSEGTWATLQAMLAVANAAKASDSQSAVDQAQVALDRAIAGLVAAPVVEEPAPVEEDGCGSAIGGAAVALVAVLALGAGVTFKKKED